jgi:hypothetical protein
MDLMIPLWEQYQHCAATSDLDELIHIVHGFGATRIKGVSPPAWLKGLSLHVKPQPLRATVDPQAIGAACTLRAAAVAVKMNRVADARALYERVLSHYASPDIPHYTAQAREALARLAELRLTMAAASSAPPQQQ